MSKHLFDQVVGEMPPSTVNTGEIVRREKRRRTSRAMVLATALVALSVAGGVTISGMGGTPVRSSAAPAVHTAPPAARTAPPSCAPPLISGPAGGRCQSAHVAGNRFAVTVDDKQSAAATAKQLRKVLDEALHKEAPGASWIFEPDYVGQPKGPDGQPPKLTYEIPKGSRGNDAPMFFGESGVVNDDRKGNLHLSVFQNNVPVEPTGTVYDMLKCTAPQPDCIEGTGPDGQKTLLWTMRYEPTPGSRIPFTSYIVRIGLPGGRVLELESANDFGIDETPAPQRLTPLTSTQVFAIAIDIAGHIEP